MPLTGKTADEIEALERQFINGVPNDGTRIGNRRLRRETLGWDEEIYFAVRRRLIEDGLIETGRGKGGSVRRIVEV